MDEGLKILYKTYWSSKGWKSGEISKEDFALAKQLGYMFDYPNPEDKEILFKILACQSKLEQKSKSYWKDSRYNNFMKGIYEMHFAER